MFFGACIAASSVILLSVCLVCFPVFFGVLLGALLPKSIDKNQRKRKKEWPQKTKQNHSSVNLVLLFG